MNARISSNDFRKEFAGYGFFKMTYISPVTGKRWTRTAPVYVWEDVFKTDDEPSQSALNSLKKYIKSAE